ncbi:uncharacterized protein LOC128276641 [Anopheles cruzii]|uniref:uncharacterized protein LOC128276641 n=1 Tax=Anopheles cruzii TaxID=68878 RepID=UPI0022EC46EB|nr:uncharacterized protein LOC128276641 [Anopheles cruzii]
MIKTLDSEMKQNSHILATPSAKQLDAMQSEVETLRQEVSNKDRVLEDLREAVNQNLRRFNVPREGFDSLETLIGKLLQKLSDRNRYWASQATGAWADTVAKQTEMEELKRLIDSKAVENVNKRAQLEKLKKSIQDKKKDCQKLESSIQRNAHAQRNHK